MATTQLKLAGGAAVIVLCAVAFGSISGSQAQELQGNYGVGISKVFVPKYLKYRAQQLSSAAPNVLRVPLGHVKGLSRSFVAMVGEIAVDLDSGAFEVRLNGLTSGLTYSVWLVDRPESDLIPPQPDDVFKLATVLAVGPSALLTGALGLNLPLDFTIDRVVVTPGLTFGGNRLAAGSVNVFQKIFFRRLSLVDESTGALLFGETTEAPKLSGLIPDLIAETAAARLDPIAMMLAPAPFFAPVALSPDGAAAAGSSGSSVPLDVLISQGAKLFFEGTFEGNGRTCGTCHPASNNLTIDPAFISTLPPSDPLFVAEFNPALEQLERPALMRSFGLILENVDGFDPANGFVMRGVPHTLGLQVTLERDTALGPNGPVEMTGWSGDGAPGTGSLREFAIGAVTQHFTKTLARVEGTDFRLPSEHQLDAMEAFQLSLGRDADFDLSKINFGETNVNTGKLLFINGNGGGRCAACHNNGGALFQFSLPQENRNFDTNVEDEPHQADLPPDGGFGRTPHPDGGFGNGQFNTPPVAEAADTAPFFHNNVVSTLEGVMRFYTTTFNIGRDPSAQFNFTDEQKDQIADFMRALNTLQNINVARRELAEILALQGNPTKEVNTRLQSASEDTQDAINVLNDGEIFPSAVTPLTMARGFITQALQSNDPAERRTLVQQAIDELDLARNQVATITP